MALNPRQQKLADRLRELIEVGRSLAMQDTSRRGASDGWIKDSVATNAYRVNTENALIQAVTENSAHYRHFKRYASSSTLEHYYDVEVVIGILQGALNDLEGGYLDKQEHLIAADVFSSVLDQAVHLNTQGYKDPAAVLGRVVVEDALRRLAKDNGLHDNLKAAVINDQLKGKVYPQPMHGQIKSWLDIGNAAAHGKFSDYTDAQVGTMLSGIPMFLAAFFAPTP